MVAVGGEGFGPGGRWVGTAVEQSGERCSGVRVSRRSISMDEGTKAGREIRRARVTQSFTTQEIK